MGGIFPDSENNREKTLPKTESKKYSIGNYSNNERFGGSLLGLLFYSTITFALFMGPILYVEEPVPQTDFNNIQNFAFLSSIVIGFIGFVYGWNRPRNMLNLVKIKNLFVFGVIISIYVAIFYVIYQNVF